MKIPELTGDEKRYQVVGLTSIENDFVDEVDEKQREFIRSAESSFTTEKVDDLALEVFTAPSKHVRDLYHILWMEALGSNYGHEQQVESAALNQWHHNASVIADDLMDGDEERRGVNSFHRSDFLTQNYPDKVEDLTFTEVIRLSTLPYAVINDSGSYSSGFDYESSIPAEDQSPMTNILSSNVIHLSSGQIEDVTGPGRMVIDDEKAYVSKGEDSMTIPDYWMPMVKGKTGTLFEASAVSGALGANYEGDEPERHADHLGVLLQYTDDLTDLQEGNDKDFMSDFVEGKPTMIVHYAMKDMEGYERSRVRQVIEQEDPAIEDLKEARELLEEENIIHTAFEDAKTYAENANKVLRDAPVENPEYAEDLKNLTDVVLYRAK